jgi:hypothetical protein
LKLRRRPMFLHTVLRHCTPIIGDKDHSFECLQKACEGGSIYMSSGKVDPELDPLGSDPRFAARLGKWASGEATTADSSPVGRGKKPRR